MTKYICKTCEYVYDPAEGDPQGRAKPGTPFENLPEDWTCPQCGDGKGSFSATS